MGTPTVERATVTCEIRKVELPDGGYVLQVPRITANPGDKIRWVTWNDNSISVWFPQAGAFFSPTLGVGNKGAVEATVRDDAAHGVYEYAIYDHDEQEFVTCESHPKVEIPKPGP
jgi:plastocyanin